MWLNVCRVIVLSTIVHVSLYVADGAQQKPCEEASTQLEMDRCAEQEAADADKALNEVYRLAMSKIGAADKEELRTAQKDWISYRDADCKAETALYSGGSIAPLIKSACVAKLTRERTSEIKRIYAHFLEEQGPQR